MEYSRLQRILGLALPIIGGMISQNVLNLVDTAMVGTLGNAALAAVGVGGFALFMCQALILGISTGVQATASRRKGEGGYALLALPLNAGLALVLLVAPPLSLLLFVLAPYFFPFLNGDSEVIAQGVPYLQIRLLSMVFIGINFAFRGYWNAVDLSRLYMTTLVVMHAANILLNYVFIFGKFGVPALGVAGAGLASLIATALGTAIYFYLGLKHARSSGFLTARPDPGVMMTLARLSIPTGLQQFFFAAGFLVTYWIIGRIGTAELAAANVLVNITLVAILPGLGLGLAAATLVGQALGRHDVEEATRWGWEVSRVAMLGLTVLGVPMWLFPDLLLSGFIHDPETLDLARMPMQLVGATMIFEALGLVLMQALLGAGDATRVMVVAITMQWVVFLPLAYIAGPVFGLGLLGIWVLQGLYRLFQSLIFVGFWHRRRWAAVKV